MVNQLPKIVFGNDAKRQLKELYEMIKQDSPQNAISVRNRIVDSIKKLTEYPYKYPADKYRSDNNIEYRAYELLKYRISYHVSEKQVTIVRIRHTKMNPLKY